MCGFQALSLAYCLATDGVAATLSSVEKLSLSHIQPRTGRTELSS